MEEVEKHSAKKRRVTPSSAFATYEPKSNPFKSTLKQTNSDQDSKNVTKGEKAQRSLSSRFMTLPERVDGEAGKRLCLLEEETGPESNSMEMYSNLMGNLYSNHGGLSQQESQSANMPSLPRSGSLSSNLLDKSFTQGRSFWNQRHRLNPTVRLKNSLALEKLEESLEQNWMLCRGFRVECKHEDSFDWIEELSQPTLLVPDGPNAGQSEQSSQKEPLRSLVNCISSYQYPSSDLPPSLFSILARLKSQVGDSRHSQFRMDGSVEIIDPASQSSTRSDSPTQLFGGGSGAPPLEKGDVRSQQFMASSARRGTFDEGRSGNGSEDIDASNFIYESRNEWVRSFQSLFKLLLHKKCPYFYYIEKESQSSSMIILFLSEGVAGNLENFPTCAMVSKSTKSLRHQLTRCNVDFECPLDPSLSKGEGTVDADLQDEWLAYSRSNAPHSSAAKIQLARASSISSFVEDDSRSLLFFRGKQNVSGLFTLFLNRIAKRAGSHQLPRLFSPVVFHQAVHKSAAVGKPSSALKLLSADSKNLKESNQVYSLQGDGFIPPQRVAELLQTLAVLHHKKEETITVEMQLDPQTQVFNDALRKIIFTHLEKSTGDDSTMKGLSSNDKFCLNIKAGECYSSKKLP